MKHPKSLPMTEHEKRRKQRLAERVIEALSGPEKNRPPHPWIVATEGSDGSITIESGSAEAMVAILSNLDVSGQAVPTFRDMGVLSSDEIGLISVLAEGGIFFERLVVSDTPFRNAGTDRGEA